MRVEEKTYSFKTYFCDKCDFYTQGQEMIERHEFLDHNPNVKHLKNGPEEDVYCFYLKTNEEAKDAARIAEYNDTLTQDIIPGWYYYQYSFEYDTIDSFKPIAELLKEEQERLDQQAAYVADLRALASQEVS